MKKEYMTPDVEKINFQAEEELMGPLSPDLGVGEWPGIPSATAVGVM